MELDRFEASPAFSEREKLVLRLVGCLASTPANVSDELYEQLRQHLNDKQLVELASAIAWENYLARSNRVFDMGSDGFSEGHFCPLPARRTGVPATAGSVESAGEAL